MLAELDITKDHCPMTFVKVKLALSRLDYGDRLGVTLSAGEPLENVPRSAEELGYAVITTERRGEDYYIVIEK